MKNNNMYDQRSEIYLMFLQLKLRFFTRITSDDAEMHESDHLFNHEWEDSERPWTVWLEVHCEERALDLTGHFPVLAGFDRSGDEIYLARISGSMDHLYLYTYVSQGTRNVMITHDSGVNVGEG